jgi:hypothetical protein
MKKFFIIVYLILLSTHASSLDIDTVKVDVLSQTSSSWDGSPLPAYLKGAPEVTILKITIPPKTQLPPHKHLVRCLIWRMNE